ncbi:hypothetical protein L202_05170 [Cryptococcus amylolentus CBS 6039]|uniref:ABM domain-containing protein n=1 Tax=Cryptococcus amylolentus CBS 6039 TaxID=1295533 RepID=A0A1E3HJI4_9TREE|nr:hypothetical protein L202_05170 [Cryptococcus amylolentus CBS 6039]ODN76503.1 hypothetical protein L202_05170 [Cryptococcus amylolentus CBS 6039]
MSTPSLPRGDFVKYVAFKAKPGKRQELLDLIIQIRDDILANEEGTLQFFVVEDPADGEIITWQEYVDDAALDARHEGKTHALWVEKKGDLVESFVSRKLPFVKK